MIPKRLYVKKSIGIKKGMGLDEIEIDFTKFSKGIIGIFGETGSGKTVLIEMCTPYLRLISRDGNLQNHFYGSDALKEFEFEFNGKTYISRIYIDADKNKVKPYLIEKVGDKEIVLNDKINEYKALVDKLFGDFDSFIYSVFSPQDNFPIISLSDAELKQLFVNIFNLNKYKDEYIPYVKSKLNDIDLQIKTEKALIEEFEKEYKNKKEFLDELKVLKNELKEIDQALDYSEKERQQYQEQIKKLEKELGQIEFDRDKYSTLLSEYNRLVKEIDSIQKDRINKLKDIEALIESNKRFIEMSLKQIEDERKRSIRFNKILDNKELIVKKYNYLNKLEDELKELQEKINKQFEIKHEIVDLELSVDATKNLISLENDKIKNYSKQIGIIDEVPCKDTPYSKKCKLLKNANEAFELIQQSKDKIEQLNNKLKSLNEQINSKRKLLDTELENKYENMKKEIDKLRSEKWDVLYNEIPEAQKNLEEINVKIAEIEEKISTARLAEDDLNKRIEKTEEYFDNKLLETQELLKKVKTEIDHFKKIKDPDTIKDKIREYEFKILQIKSEVNELNQKLVNVQADIKYYENKLQEFEAKEQKINEMKNKISNYIDEYSQWKVIEKFLKELPVIEIKVLSKALTQQVNDLLNGLFDYSLSIDIITEMEKASGDGKKDVFKIIVYNDGDKMLGKYLSGGQKQIVDLAIRMGIEILKNLTVKKKYLTTFMDEADAKLDTERALKFLSMLEKVHKINNKHFTFLISHRTEIKNNVDQVIDINEFSHTGEVV